MYSKNRLRGRKDIDTPCIRIIVIAGVRPQYTKVAALQWAIHKYNQQAKTKIKALFLNTGQHYDRELAEDQIQDLKIHFDYSLTHHNRHPVNILGNMIIGTYHFLENLSEKTDWVVVLGDTTSTMAGAIGAARLGIPIVHIEAGMRSGNLTELEEINRKIVDSISTLHICTSRIAVDNLKKEGFIKSVFWSGDWTYEFVKKIAQIVPTGIDDYHTGEYIIATLHKPENINSDHTLTTLITTLSKQDRPVMFITHPRTRARLKQLDLDKVSGINFVHSLPYTKMISAIKGCAYIVTDSGGLHREAYYFHKRCLLRRDKGGWVELISRGVHRYIGTDEYNIVEGLKWIENRLKENKLYNLKNDGLIRYGSSKAVLDILVKQTKKYSVEIK